MMGGGAFFLLKGGQTGPESTRQAEARVAILPRILQTAAISGGGSSVRPRKDA